MYFHLTLLSILSLFSVNSGKDIDWWDVLSTDLSCCSTHSNSYDCNNEGANACSFVDQSATCAPGKAGKDCRFTKRLADEFGDCLQESFIACKVAAGKINACCAPGCKGIDPPKGPPPAGQPPANGVQPVCFPKVTPAPVTPAPVTPAPVTPAPVTPRPTTPAPVTPRPTTPAPVTPRPTTPRPTTPSPTTPRPTTPRPTTPAPVTPRPTTPSPTTPAPTTPAPTTPRPTTPSPTTPAPTTPRPTTPRPTTPSPTTPRPTTPRPTTPSPTTPSPTTPQPTTACSLGVNYAFSGQACKISGDPHTTMFNGDKHDFQGQPAIDFGGDIGLKNQFYYIKGCCGDGRDTDIMPFSVLGTHYHWGTRDVSGIEYITVTLYDGGAEYYAYFSANIAYYIMGGPGVDTDYEIQRASGGLMAFADKATTSIGTGGKFQVYVNKITTDKKLWVKITIDGSMEFTIYMAGQTTRVTDQFGDYRYRMHYVQMSVPEALKCYTCGLCGNFKTFNTGTWTQYMEGCDCGMIAYRPGWKPNSTPEAYDQDGWSWERNYVENDCSSNYDTTDNIEGTVTDPCPDGSAIAEATADECESQLDAIQDCCDTIGGTVCDDLLTDCKVDACVGADGDLAAVEDQVTALLTETIQDICTNDDLIEDTQIFPDLECPSGSIKSNNGNNAISGHGLTTNDDRFGSNADTIENCEIACRNNNNCVAFSYAPLNGDENNEGERVCTLFDSTTPTTTVSPSQIFCELVTTTCSLTSYVIVDDEQETYVSSDGGNNFGSTPISSEYNWWVGETTMYGTISTDNVIKIKATNTGGPGALVGTFVLENDNDGSTYSITTNSNTIPMYFTVYKSDGTTEITSNGNYYAWGTAWGSTQAQGVDTAEAAWFEIPDSDGTYYFILDISGLEDALRELGCYGSTSRARQYTLARRHKKVNDGNTFTYQRNKKQFVEMNHNKLRNGITENDDNDALNTFGINNMEIFGIFGLVLILCAAGLYYKRKNKSNGYISLNEGSSDVHQYSRVNYQTI